MAKKVQGYVAIIIIIYMAVNGFMYLRQPAMVFFPARDLSENPDDWGLQYDDVFIKTADGVTINGWFIPEKNSDKALLFLHGNGGNISHRKESVEIFNRLGLNVFIIDYRGYGISEGSPDEKGLYLDAQIAWDYLIKKGFDKTKIIIFGRSLGGAIAINLASKVKPGALIIESTFSSARDMGQSIFPLLSRVLIFRYSFNSGELIKKINSPLLVIHSPDDEIIPFKLGKKVFDAANEPKSFFSLQGDHNNGFIISQPDYEKRLAEFIMDK